MRGEATSTFGGCGFVAYIRHHQMIGVRLTEAFEGWLDGLRDVRAKAIIARRLDGARFGNLGGGDKASQKRDIRRAKALAEELD